MQYTTQNLATKFGKTSQTVRNAAKQLNLRPRKDEESKSFVFTQKQAEKLAARFGCELETEEPKEAILGPEEARIQELKIEIEHLREELNSKDEMIAFLISTVDRLTSTNEALVKTNALREANENKDMLLLQETKEKKGFFKRLFG